MTGREVVELIKKNVGVPWNEQSYRDTFKLGNPDSTVKGIATTVMVTFDMLKRANQAGLNMVIAHEDTFWNDRDETKDLTANPLYKLKTEYVLKNDMIVWRIHDHMHSMRPDYTVVGSLRSVGVKGGEDAVMRPRIYTIPETTFGEFASQVKRLTGSRAFRCVGDPKARVSKILLGPGYATPRMTAASSRKPTALSTTWNTWPTQRRLAWRKALSCWATSFPSSPAWKISATGCERSSKTSPFSTFPPKSPSGRKPAKSRRTP